MASTYSTSLRLELMATGDQSGTWGTTTNTNLGTLLEQAITGYLSVAQGDVANLTLTTNNGATDQARNAVVRITGALTATRNVVVQTAAKLYSIANDTTGGFSIVAKTAAGTGVSIPPGAMMNVYSDGTNVVVGANYWSGQIGGQVYLDAGATVGPVMDLFRDSTSPAVSDIMGQVVFNGRDSAGNKQEYASIESVITDATSATEDGQIDVYLAKAGARTKFLSLNATATALTGSAAYTMDAPLTVSSTGTGVQLAATSTDSGAVSGPNLFLNRDSASPAASDTLGDIAFNGRSSTNAIRTYGEIYTTIVSPTNGVETGALKLAITANGNARFIQVLGDTSGNVILDLSGTGAGWVQFPATQNPSAGANTLDDYEEGTATITAAFATPGTSSWAYTTQAIAYTKVGNEVGITYNFQATPTIGTGSGILNLTGNPFTPASAFILALGTLNNNWTWTASRTMVYGGFAAASATLTLVQLGTAASPNTISASNMSTGGSHTFNASGIYTV